MADKYHSDTQAKIEFLNYYPNLQDTGDLEPGTKTITATAKQATPDCSKTLTLPMPTDSRYQVEGVGGQASDYHR